MRLFRPGFAGCLVLVCAVAGLPAAAVEPPPGSKNFSAPGSVPNYFSNESSSLQGGAAARSAEPRLPNFAAAPASAPRVRSAAVKSSGRHLRGRVVKGRGRTVLARAQGSAKRGTIRHAAARTAPARGGRHAAAHSSRAQTRPAVQARPAAVRAVVGHGRTIAPSRSGGGPRVARAGR